jgi:NAD(P)-dependent dehydrogenase (short-subunit alcohol dehydrogenase family)
MKDFKGKIAVITGGCMGIGRALAEQALAEGVAGLVIGDLQAEDLDKAADELNRLGYAGEVVTVAMDVSVLEDNQRLLDVTLSHFGQVNLAFFNAGIGGSGFGVTSVLQADLAAWRWVEEVNFWGVLYGCKLFGSAMVEQAQRDASFEGHIINTASMAGLGPGMMGAYSTSKHAAVTLTEVLLNDFQRVNKELHPGALWCSVMCPAFVDTNIFNQTKYKQVGHKMSAEEEEKSHRAFAKLPGSIPPAQVARDTFDSIRARHFYILPHPLVAEQIVKERATTILAKAAPSAGQLVNPLQWLGGAAAKQKSRL